MDDFLALSGDLVDQNKRSQVLRLEIGSPRRCFYLKRHTHYVTRSWRHRFAAVPMIRQELENLVDYARIGLDALEPAAWGWRFEGGRSRGFILMEELTGYHSLNGLLSGNNGTRALVSRHLRPLGRAVAATVSRVHRAGFAHRDLFSWHVFVRTAGENFDCQLIDLERSQTGRPLPGIRWWRRRKQAGDLATLHLTVPFQQVGPGRRMRFFLDYLGRDTLDDKAKAFLKIVFKEARRKSTKNKFRPYGVSDLLRRRPGA